jgi:hypothetical protein
MKTKWLFAATALSSIFQTGFSQDYHPLLDHSSWVVNDLVSCCRPPYVYTIDEGTDVVINGQAYKEFNDPFPQYDTNSESYVDVVDLREDVAARKVYKLVNGTEMLLYDFSMQNGDTIWQYDFNWTAAVDEIDCDGGSRKRITLQTQYNNHTMTQVWIEGVGTIAHPFYPASNMYSVFSAGGGLTYHTKCSFQNGVHIYGNAECAAYAPLAVAAQDYQKGVSFLPNPVISDLNLSSANELQNATLKFYNLQGQLVREVNKISGTAATVNRGNLSRGLYFVELIDGGHLLQTGKLMLE